MFFLYGVWKWVAGIEFLTDGGFKLSFLRSSGSQQIGMIWSISFDMVVRVWLNDHSYGDWHLGFEQAQPKFKLVGLRWKKEIPWHSKV